MRCDYDREKASARAKLGRVPVYLAFSLVMALWLSLAPFSVQGIFSTSDNRCPNPVHVALNVEPSKAYAYDPGQSLAYLQTLAEAAGVTNSQLVAGLGGMASVATGMILATEGGQSMGASLADNLSHMVYASTYVPYEDLSSTEQANWYSKEDYEAYYFSELCQAYGLPTVDGFYGSNGGSLDQEQTDKLHEIGAVIDKWIKKGSVPFEQIKELVNKQKVAQYLGITGGQPGGGSYDGEDDTNWPSGVPFNVNYATDVTNLWVMYNNRSDLIRYWTVISDQAVYATVYHGVASDPTNEVLQILLFSKSTFSVVAGSGVDIGDNLSSNYAVDTYNGFYGNHYYLSIRANIKSFTASNISANSFDVTTLNANRVANCILYNAEPGGSSQPDLVPDMGGYPEGGSDSIPDETPIYYPPTVNNNTTYNNYTNPQYPNPYNPEDQTSTEEWKNETEANINNALSDLKLNKLFPFSLLYDITTLANKVKAVTVDQQTSGQYSSITIPIRLPWINDNLVINLSDLYGLLTGTRIFVQILLVVTLLVATIKIWSGVLGGQ